tara:strand:- start:5600 stop:6559 length:960 start_codon:yes stop_codon:yes gene_type:complete
VKAVCLVIGTGSAGYRHISVLKQLGAEVLVFPLRSSRLDYWSEKGFQVIRDWSDNQLSRVTHVVIASETKLHLEYLSKFALHGVPVLIEKPVSISSADMNAFTEKHKEFNEEQIQVACCLRFSKSLQKFRESLADVDRLHSVFVRCQSYLPDWRPSRDYKESYSADMKQGGVMRDLVHELDYTGWIFGWPETLSSHALSTGRLDIQVDDVALMNWASSEGFVCSIYLDYLSRSPERGIKAYGEKGMIEWDGITGEVFFTEGKREREKIFSESQTLEQLTLAQDRAFLNEDGEDHIFLASWRDGLNALKMIDDVQVQYCR